MSTGQSTCWTLIEEAARGTTSARDSFTTIYLGVVRTYLSSRWRNDLSRQRLDDAVQDVFFECFRPGGPLDRVARGGKAAFRTYLYAVVHNVALRHEERGRRQEQSLETAPVAEMPTSEPTISVAFDRAWARTLLQNARERQRRAAIHDAEKRRGVEVLDLRFGEGLPIRDIARRLELPADEVHTLYRRAREDFKLALREEVAFHGNDEPAAIERECLRILGLVGDKP